MYVGVGIGVGLGWLLGGGAVVGSPSCTPPGWVVVHPHAHLTLVLVLPQRR
jgi:hypothetical protein